MSSSIDKELEKRYQAELLNYLSLSISNILIVSIREVMKLYTTINIKFIFEDVKLQDNTKRHNSLLGNFGGNVSYEDKELLINIIIYKDDNTLSWEDFLVQLLNENTGTMASNGIAFVYIHELSHIFFKHLSKHKKFYNYVDNYISENQIKNEIYKHFGKDVNSNSRRYIINLYLNLGMDFFINSNIKEIIPSFYELYVTPDFLYNPDLNHLDMNELDITKFLIDESKYTIKEDTDTFITIELNIESQNFKKYITIYKDMQGTIDLLDEEIEEGENRSVVKARGIGVEEILNKLGLPLKINISWFNKLKSELIKESYIHTKKTKVTWAKKNIFYKQYTFPGKKYLNDTPNIIISYDVSGSMSDTELRKMNYIIKELNKKGSPITTIEHTSVINNVSYFKSKSYDIDNFLNYRRYSGGTSHMDVFTKIEEIIETTKSHNNIILIMSDFYSDIKEIWNKTKWNKKEKIFYINTAIKDNHIEDILYKNIKLININT